MRDGAIKWDLAHLSQALTRAKRMEKKRASFFEELYESVVYPTSQIDSFEMRSCSARVDTQAIRIMELKDRYDKKLQQEHEKYGRWCDLLAVACERDQIILVRYFQQGKSIAPEVVSRVLHQIEKDIQKQNKRIESERERKAMKEYSRHRPAPIPTDKKHYFIGDKFVYMTEEEHEAYQNEKKAKQRNRFEFYADNRKVGAFS